MRTLGTCKKRITCSAPTEKHNKHRAQNLENISFDVFHAHSAYHIRLAACHFTAQALRLQLCQKDTLGARASISPAVPARQRCQHKLERPSIPPPPRHITGTTGGISYLKMLSGSLVARTEVPTQMPHGFLALTSVPWTTNPCNASRITLA